MRAFAPILAVVAAAVGLSSCVVVRERPYPHEQRGEYVEPAPPPAVVITPPQVVIAPAEPVTVTCESRGEGHVYCPTYANGGVQLQRQLSKAACRQYRTWGADPDGGGIWVDRGCRGVFVVVPWGGRYPAPRHHRR